MTTEEFLVKLGVDPHHVGFDYICMGARIMRREPHCKLMSAYADIARAHGTSASCVERAIRYAIATALDRFGAEWVGRLLGQMPDLSGSYTNARFLALVARQTMPR